MHSLPPFTIFYCDLMRFLGWIRVAFCCFLIFLMFLQGVRIEMKKILLFVVTAVLISGVVSVRYDAAQVAFAQEELRLGGKVYQDNCAVCHGTKGDGKGPEAHRLKTKPRDFTTGMYRFQSTPSGSLPTDDDIFTTVSRGVRGTSMLAQLDLSEKERWAVTEYLKTFSNRFKTEKPLRSCSCSGPTIVESRSPHAW